MTGMPPEAPDAKLWTLQRGINWPVWLKLMLCAGYDLWDFTLGRVFIGFSLGSESLDLLALVFLWGPSGLLAAWEMLDGTEQLDAFIPTDLLIGLGVWLTALSGAKPHNFQKRR